MNKTIAELINDYSNNDKTINNNFIPEIFKIVLENENLSDYILGINQAKFSGIFNYAIAVYRPISKSIEYDYKKIISGCKKQYKQNFAKVKPSNMYIYLCILQKLLHEIEHARQFRKIKEMKTLEDYILSIDCQMINDVMKGAVKNPGIADNPSFQETFKIFDYVINKKLYYEFSPSERLADIHAKQQVRDISFLLENEQLYEMMQYDYYQALLRGYYLNNPKNKVDIPTKYFFDNINKSDIWPEILEKSRNISELEKIKLGLEVKREVLEEMKAKSDALILKLRK